MTESTNSDAERDKHELKISVICAAPPGATKDCLQKTIEGLLAEMPERSWECLVLTADKGENHAARRHTPEGVETLETETLPSDLVPHLWGWGFERARGSILLLTSAGLMPSPGWLKRHLELHEDPAVSGVGGGFTISDRASAFQKAIGWSRYHAHVGVGVKQDATDFAADNGSYKKRSLSGLDALGERGFWEPGIHRRLLSEGGRLLTDSECSMVWFGGLAALRFLEQRVRHGFEFGRDRTDLQGIRRLIYLLLSWALPFILTRRCLSSIRRSGKGQLETMGMTPSLLLIYSAWSIGEVWGAFINTANRITQRAHD